MAKMGAVKVRRNVFSCKVGLVCVVLLSAGGVTAVVLHPESPTAERYAAAACVVMATMVAVKVHHTFSSWFSLGSVSSGIVA